MPRNSALALTTLLAVAFAGMVSRPELTPVGSQYCSSSSESIPKGTYEGRFRRSGAGSGQGGISVSASATGPITIEVDKSGGIDVTVKAAMRIGISAPTVNVQGSAQGELTGTGNGKKFAADGKLSGSATVNSSLRDFTGSSDGKYSMSFSVDSSDCGAIEGTWRSPGWNAISSSLKSQGISFKSERGTFIAVAKDAKQEVSDLKQDLDNLHQDASGRANHDSVRNQLNRLQQDALSAGPGLKDCLMTILMEGTGKIFDALLRRDERDMASLTDRHVIMNRIHRMLEYSRTIQLLGFDSCLGSTIDGIFEVIRPNLERLITQALKEKNWVVALQLERLTQLMGSHSADAAASRVMNVIFTHLSKTLRNLYKEQRQIIAGIRAMPNPNWCHADLLESIRAIAHVERQLAVLGREAEPTPAPPEAANCAAAPINPRNLP